MARIWKSCILCGWMIEARETNTNPSQWTSEFRGLCSDHAGRVLTGVGQFSTMLPRGRILRAPRDRNKRWDDPELGPLDMYSFYVDLNVSVTTQRNWQLGEGFVFHDACWRLLQEVFYPLPIPLERLLDVFRSLPSESTLSAQPAFWGHDYGGVALINTGDYFPWEVSPFFAPPAPASFGLPGSDPVFEDDPSQTVGFHHLVQLNSKAPEQPHIALRRAATQPSRPSAKDPFLALPKELCNAIAVLLPTADALRARLVSRAFWPIFYDQHFWISRFKAPRSRSWLFEARDGPATDWRSLYRRTRDNAHLPRDLINRRRIWGLLKQVESIVALTWHPLPPSLPQEWSFDAAVNDTHPGHVHNEVGGLFSHSFGMGCTLLTEQKVAIPKLLERLSIHIASFGGEVHVVGMSFATATDTVHLGYSSSSVQSVQVKELWGFRVALGFRGIRGLQCVTGPGESESPWLGSLDDTLQTDRLVTGGRVIGIVVGFDAGKIVSLTTKTRLPSSGMKCPGQSGLRDSSLWYPSVPSQTVSLNDDTFVLQDYGEIGFKPLFHCHFGGPGGVYLRHLIGITGVKSRGSLLRIVFSFDRPVPEAHQRFGRSRVRSNEATASFAIDGPRGERIVAIKINYLAYRSALREEIDSFVQRFEVRTNRGRTLCIFEDSPIHHPEPQTEVEASTPGTAITGLYAVQENMTIKAIGIMTENVDDTHDTVVG